MPLAHGLRQQPEGTVVLVNPLHLHRLKAVDAVQQRRERRRD